MIKWSDLKAVKIPLVEVGVLIGIVITGYIWADDLQDAQTTTQTQLAQLVTIVTESTKERNEQDKIHDKALTSIEKSLALIVQEAQLRREFQALSESPTN